MKLTRKIALFGMVLALAACAGTGEKTGEIIDDSVITTKVKTALIAEKGIDSTDISVKTDKGRVLLSGYVKSEQQRSNAERIARGTGGVRTVVNNLQVR